MVLQVFRDEKLLANTVARGAQLMVGLNALKGRFPIKEVCGAGDATGHSQGWQCSRVPCRCEGWV